MPRAQNAHAILQAGFHLKIKDNMVQTASIVYGCINTKFIHATATENFVLGKNLFNNETLQEVFRSLDNELIPTYSHLEASSEFRKKLAIALFYKVICVQIILATT